MNEHSETEGIGLEQRPEGESASPRVHLEFEYKNIYNQRYADHKIDTWTLPERPSFPADIFDGYLHTDFGQFAIEKPIEIATKVIADIREFCRISQELKTAEKSLADAESQHRELISRFQRLNDTKGWTRTHREVESIKTQISRLKHELAQVEQKTKEYRV